MSTEGRVPGRIITPLVAIGLVLVSVVSLIAFLALSAYAPDLRNESNGDANVLSKSAIGFAGLRVLLDASNIPNVVDRGLAPHGTQWRSLSILTPSVGNKNGEILRLVPSRSCLIVLPKWLPMPDPTAYGRVLKVGAFPTAAIQKLLGAFSKDTKIVRQSENTAPYLFSSVDNIIRIPARSVSIDSLQTISGKDWLPLVVNQKGGVLLAKLRLAPVYVLADPDVMNTQGLRDLPTAALSLAIITNLQLGRGVVALDTTLNGFRKSPSLLRDAFAPPFLGATLCAILAAALIGFHAAARFGTPRIASPIFALGKQALASNTADLIRMMRREPHMAARYAVTTRNLALRALGVRRQMDLRQTDALLAVLERDGGITYAELLAEAEQVKSRSHLVTLANRLFRWRQEMIHAR